MSEDIAKYGMSNTNHNVCANCIHYKEYYEKTENRFVKTSFGWCVVKHNHLVKEDYCDRFVQKEKENYQMSIKRILEDFAAFLLEYSKNLSDENDSIKNNN